MPTKFLEALKNGDLHTDVHHDIRGTRVQFFMVDNKKIINCTNYVNIALQTEAKDFLKLDRYLENPYLRVKECRLNIERIILDDLARKGYEVSFHYTRLLLVK